MGRRRLACVVPGCEAGAGTLAPGTQAARHHRQPPLCCCLPHPFPPNQTVGLPSNHNTALPTANPLEGILTTKKSKTMSQAREEGCHLRSYHPPEEMALTKTMVLPGWRVRIAYRQSSRSTSEQAT